ncbi:MAG: YbjQ family protein [Cyanobacteria bacterium J149]|nr:MAG: YbjQ family protein [Cyanobacteria bacterium J149]
MQNREISSYLGVVTAEVIYGTNALRDFFAGIRDMFGGRTGSYEKVFEKAQLEAIEELKKRAIKLNADAVIGIKVDTGTINVDQEGVLLLVTATGTAVSLQ